ncbi:MAG: neutral/alkaline non-lysosomal ceramidase N-terminal domain-containing protein [Candidatus Bathyarchaeia archaeon]
MNANTVKAGAAQVDITPPIGTLLAGNVYPRKSDGVDYPLYSKALVLSDGEKSAVIVSLDLLAVSRKYIDEACKEIYRKTGIPREYVLISATHTHSGPYSIPSFEGEFFDYQFMSNIPEKIALSVEEAYEGLKSAEIGIASTTVSSITHNRRLIDENGSAWNSWLLPREKRKRLKPAGPVDDQLLVLAVREGKGTLKAIVFNYAMHACVSGTTTKISSDYPGAVAKRLSERVDRDIITLFLPGACGNINFNYDFSLEKISETLTVGILSAVNHAEYIKRFKLKAILREVTFPTRKLLESQWEEISLKWPNALEVFKKGYEYLNSLREEEIKTFIHTLAIDDVAFSGIPGELFCELGLRIKDASPYKYNFVVELANDCIGYIPTSEAFEQGGYETWLATSSRVAPGSGERIVQEILNMLNMLKKD